jgi:hypothetical protein
MGACTVEIPGRLKQALARYDIPLWVHMYRLLRKTLFWHHLAVLSEIMDWQQLAQYRCLNRFREIWLGVSGYYANTVREWLSQTTNEPFQHTGSARSQVAHNHARMCFRFELPFPHVASTLLSTRSPRQKNLPADCRKDSTIYTDITSLLAMPPQGFRGRIRSWPVHPLLHRCFRYVPSRLPPLCRHGHTVRCEGPSTCQPTVSDENP